jgi:hypothetical protein
MAWVATGVAIGGALLGRKDTKDADQQASSDRARELELHNRQLDLAERQDERAGKLFKHYEDVFVPREAELVGDTFSSELSPARAEARATADVRSSLATARGSSERGLRRLGVDPGSGTSLALNEQRGLEEARIEAGARTGARESVRDRNFSRQATVLGFGSPTAASPYAGAAQAGVSGVSELAAMRSRDSAASAYEAAGNYGASLGDLVDAGLGAWRNRRRKSNGGIEAGGPYERGRSEGYV